MDCLVMEIDPAMLGVYAFIAGTAGFLIREFRKIPLSLLNSKQGLLEETFQSSEDSFGKFAEEMANDKFFLEGSLKDYESVKRLIDLKPHSSVFCPFVSYFYLNSRERMRYIVDRRIEYLQGRLRDAA